MTVGLGSPFKTELTEQNSICHRFGLLFCLTELLGAAEWGRGWFGVQRIPTLFIAYYIFWGPLKLRLEISSQPTEAARIPMS